MKISTHIPRYSNVYADIIVPKKISFYIIVALNESISKGMYARGRRSVKSARIIFIENGDVLGEVTCSVSRPYHPRQSPSQCPPACSAYQSACRPLPRIQITGLCYTMIQFADYVNYSFRKPWDSLWLLLLKKKKKRKKKSERGERRKQKRNYQANKKIQFRRV